MNIQFRRGFLAIIWDLTFSAYNAYISTQFQTSFKPVSNPLVEVTVNRKKENFCPEYVQEFGLISPTVRSSEMTTFISGPRVKLRQ